VLRTAIALIRDRLPSAWKAAVRNATAADGLSGVDAELRVTSSDGQRLIILLEAKRLLNTRDVPMVLAPLQDFAAQRKGDEEVVVVIAARYLAKPTRARIADAGASYVDATGNMLVRADRPALFLRDRGADRDPWRGPGRPRGSLQGPPAARVVRALVDFAPPYTVPELSQRADASIGATYRVVEFLEEEGLIERERREPIRDVPWRRLLERWSEDYGFARSNTVETFLEPRGLSRLMERLAKTPKLEYVVTGSLAAERVAAYAPARLATIYVRDIPTVAESLGLRPVDTGANIALAAGDYDVVFERDERVDGLRVAALSQVAVDLLSGPGRNPSEARALLDWMESNERAWRR
jgi:hypothetical protein